MSPTLIEWTDETWNPIRARRRDGTGKVGWACVRVSPGCVNCYAATQNRSGWAGGTRLDYTVPDLAKVETYVDVDVLRAPLRWRKSRRIFVCSMTDLFGEWVTDDEVDEVWASMLLARRHTFQVLTKRPDRMRAYVRSRYAGDDGAPPHIWLGTSVEDQQRADERIPHLLDTPAAVRFLSCEPLLGAVDLSRWQLVDQPAGVTIRTLDWVIVGGESGPRARPMDLAWARSLVEQCRVAGVAPFVKQLGRYPIIKPALYGNPHTQLVLRESHGRDMAEWPEDLRVREWPTG